MVTKVPEAIAGSTPFLVKKIGINIPKNEPKIKFKNSENDITKLKRSS